MTELVAYNPSNFQKELSKVQGYLAELRYIDTAMAYLETQRPGPWHTAADTFGLSTESPQIVVEFGTTHPFTKSYELAKDVPQLPWDRGNEKERVEGQLQVLAEEADTWAATEIEWITNLMKPFTWPVGSLYESGCIRPVEDAYHTLDGKVTEDFGELNHSLGDWGGDAADSFATNFYHPFEQTLRSQRGLLQALAGGIASAKLIAEATQDSLMNVVHHTGEALDEQLKRAADTAELARRESVQNTMILAGGAAAAFGGIVSAGGSLWVAALAAVDGGATIASSAIAPDAWTVFNLHGATAEELLGAMSDAIDQIAKNDREQHEGLERKIKDVLDRAETLRDGGDEDDGRLIPIRPNLVDGVDPDEFYHAETRPGGP